MCDLDDRERTELLGTLDDITELCRRVEAHRTSIGATSYVEHAELGSLLERLTDLADSAHHWVTTKASGH